MSINPHHIIAIGASAGGMEEINVFFDHTPLDGVSYVVVQHLSPDFKSRMVELLSRHSRLTVTEAEHKMQVQCNQVYLIPHNKYMTIENNRLMLSDKELVRGPHLTINTFFESLAKNSGEKAIGVVLSGLGADGAEGVQAIKNAGGMVIARNPDTAAFSSMPASAIATGSVDFILEPELMPDTIEQFVQQEINPQESSKDEDKNLAVIIDLIRQNSLQDFTDYKPSTILRRIKRRAAMQKLLRLDQYIAFLQANPDEIDALAKDFLISVTAFFRDKEAFDFIETDILPGILKKVNAGEELKMWVAGCATGEEAYSLAMLVSEQLTGPYKDLPVKIFATDMDSSALTFARKGLYADNISKQVSPQRLAAFFTKDGDKYQVDSNLRKMVIFAEHDIVKNPPYCNMHLISCRNLLIYMAPMLQHKVFAMLLFGLKWEGILFLGSSENPLSIIDNLEIVNSKWKIYRSMEAKRTISTNPFSIPEKLQIKHAAPYLAKAGIVQTGNITITEAVNGILVKEKNILVVCIDENNQVVKSYGDTNRFLLAKNFNSNLVDLLPEPLALAFNTIRINAQITNEPVRVNGIKIKKGETVMLVSLAVRPVSLKNGDQKLLMVTLQEDMVTALLPTEGTSFNDKDYLDQYTRNLEQELKELQHKLDSTHEKLDAYNENMQSFNEELLSANEEMQSSNEEMQSVNEELHTINTDYQLKNKELVDMNDDLNNYFRSNLNGQLFVNRDLLLMKFSPGTVKHINLLDTDIGRPISNISTNIKFETIVADINNVLEKGGVITKDVEATNGKWYQVMTMPYVRQADNRKDGAIITFSDITELKKIQEERDATNKHLRSLNKDLDNFVLTASHDLLVPLSNIEGVISLIRNIKISNTELESYLSIMDSSVKNFRSIIKELSAIGKLESDLQNKKAIKVAQLFDEIKLTLIDRIAAANAIFTTDFKVPTINFSKKNLRSILLNLVSNSLTYTSDDRAPKIQVSTSFEENYTVLSVADNGIGISKVQQEKLFKLYNQLEPNKNGQGIGLYLVKKVVETAGGKVLVESEFGRGSVFKIYLK